MREPQLAAARSEVKAAQAALAHAETLLGYADIRAPFNGVVMKRSVNPGESLFAGDEVAVLYDANIAEISIQLDAVQWALLHESIYDTKVILTDSQQQATWEAGVVRESRHLSRDSRQRTIFLQVKQPLRRTPPLLPGTFVRAEITGRKIHGLLCIPETALTKKGIVWFVDRHNQLQPHQFEPVFYGEGMVYIRNPENTDRPVRIAMSPNSSFASGLVIQPIPSMREH
jgi:multidrug efflux pump subunit AcrA (membrane-fusion protein)